METTNKKRYTTLSVEIGLKDKLDQAIVKKQRKLSYNALLAELLEEFLTKKI